MPKALFYIGGVNRGIGYVAKAAGKGIAAFELDLDTGSVEPLGITEGIDNPTFIAFAPQGHALAAVSEVDGWHEGLVTTYEIKDLTASLRYLNKQATRGDYTCHTAFDRTGRYVGIANYGGLPITEEPNKSFAIYPADQMGRLGTPTAEVAHQGSGPNASRQDRPHAHCIQWTPDNRFVIVSDLGLDRLKIYRFDASTGTVEKHGEAVLPPGSGPRHFCFHPSLPIVYCVTELDCALVTMAFDAEAGTLQATASTSTLPQGGHDGASASAIAISRDARHVYVGNRGHDSVARFSADPQTGIATFLGTTPSGGRIPRDLALDPSGTILVVANQESDCLTLFRYRPETGDLDPIEPAVAVGSPTVVAFHPHVR